VVKRESQIIDGRLIESPRPGPILFEILALPNGWGADWLGHRMRAIQLGGI
jgi:hypothetical protein